MEIDHKKGLLGISPLLFFLVFFVGASLVAHDFAKVPVAVAFMFSTVFAIATTKGLSLPDRVRVFGRGAGTTKMMFMVLIFLSAGAFARSADGMGCIDATVNVIMSVFPARFLYAGLFITGCVVSMATGSGMGAIVSLAPIAVGICHAIDGNMSMLCGIVVCGALFGDNLSFISDTTVVATTTQGCEMKDKFRANIWIALPAAVLTLVLLLFLGRNVNDVSVPAETEYIKIIPYALIIVLSVLGADVLILLLSGTVLCGIMGMMMGEFDFYGWMAAIDSGFSSMCPLVVIVIFASGLLALVKHNGGIDYIISLCTGLVRSKRSAEACIALLSALMTICTSTNTIAIMSISSVVKELSVKFGVEPKRAASLMDTGACSVQEFIPYSPHLLAASALAGITTTSMIPYVFYSYLLLLSLIVSIAVGGEKKH